MTSLNELSIAELAELIRKQEISPVEVTRSCIDCIARLNDKVNAVVTLQEADKIFIRISKPPRPLEYLFPHNFITNSKGHSGLKNNTDISHKTVSRAFIIASRVCQNVGLFSPERFSSGNRGCGSTRTAGILVF